MFQTSRGWRQSQRTDEAPGRFLYFLPMLTKKKKTPPKKCLTAPRRFIHRVYNELNSTVQSLMSALLGGRDQWGAMITEGISQGFLVLGLATCTRGNNCFCTKDKKVNKDKHSWPKGPTARFRHPLYKVHDLSWVSKCFLPLFHPPHVHVSSFPPNIVAQQAAALHTIPF